MLRPLSHDEHLASAPSASASASSACRRAVRRAGRCVAAAAVAAAAAAARQRHRRAVFIAARRAVARRRLGLLPPTRRRRRLRPMPPPRRAPRHSDGVGGLERGNSNPTGGSRRHEALSCAVSEDASSCEVSWVCDECRMLGSTISLHLELLDRFVLAHAIDWAAHASWSKDQPIAGRSALSGVLTPSCNAEGHDGNNATAGCLLRGHEPSTLTLTLVPTLYDNSINNTSARGFRLQYLSSDAGGRAAPTAISATSGSLRFNVLLKPVATEYAISVAQPQLFVEFISRRISLGAGLAVFCRCMLWLYLSTLHARAVRLTHESREAVRAVRRRHRSRNNYRRFSDGLNTDPNPSPGASDSDASQSSAVCVPTATAYPSGVRVSKRHHDGSPPSDGTPPPWARGCVAPRLARRRVALGARRARRAGGDGAAAGAAVSSTPHAFHALEEEEESTPGSTPADGAQPPRLRRPTAARHRPALAPAAVLRRSDPDSVGALVGHAPRCAPPAYATAAAAAAAGAAAAAVAAAGGGERSASKRPRRGGEGEAEHHSLDETPTAGLARPSPNNGHGTAVGAVVDGRLGLARRRAGRRALAQHRAVSHGGGHDFPAGALPGRRRANSSQRRPTTEEEAAAVGRRGCRR